MGILINDGVEYTDKPKLDKTLSIEGQAADAKAVGDTKISHADVVDNLESTETKLPLSANKGRELSEKITGIPKFACGQSYIGGGNTSSEVIDLSTVLPENSTILCIQISQLYTTTSGVHALAYEANETDRTLIVHSREANSSGRIHFFYTIYYTE